MTDFALDNVSAPADATAVTATLTSPSAATVATLALSLSGGVWAGTAALSPTPADSLDPYTFAVAATTPRGSVPLLSGTYGYAVDGLWYESAAYLRTLTTLGVAGAGLTAVGGVAGDVGGKVLGGGAGTITGTGVRSDLRSIDGVTTASGQIALSLRSLLIYNPAGDAFAAISGSGWGANFQGTTGGIQAYSSAGPGVYCLGGSGFPGVWSVGGAGAPGFKSTAGSGNADGVTATASGTGKAFGPLAADVAALILSDPTKKLLTDADGKVTTSNPAQTTIFAGTGDTPVDHNTGGTDALRYVDGSAQGIDGAIVRAYVAADYAAGSGTAEVKGQAVTRDDGRWVAPMMLNHGVPYTLTFDAEGYSLAVMAVTP